MTDDPYNLQRFVDAQEPVYASVVDELGQGRKTGHWIWFIFPQIAGLGRSEMAQRYAITSIEEAHAYFEHPVLGRRLIECVQLLLDVNGRTAGEILGDLDAMKFRSCLTLFFAASGGNTIFEAALEKFFDGIPDLQTLSAFR